MKHRICIFIRFSFNTKRAQPDKREIYKIFSGKLIKPKRKNLSVKGDEMLIGNEGKNLQTHEQKEFLYVNVPANHRSENSSENCRLVSIV
jgi:hypothetical protein